MSIFKGVANVLNTPFADTATEKKVNYDTYEKLCDYQLGAGMDALVVCATGGEGPTVMREEQTNLLDIAVSKAKAVGDRKVPVIMSTGTNDTSKVIANAKIAKEHGADAQLVVSPYYNKSSQEGLYQHYSTIAKATDLPIIVYNVPSRTGVTIAPTTMARMINDVDTIRGVKEATGSVLNSAEVMNLTNGEAEIYAGDDGLTTATLAIGGKGVIGTTSNIAPKEFLKITNSWFAGDIETAIKTQIKLMPLINAMFADVNPVPIKYAVSLLGFDMGNVRMPLYETSDSVKELVQTEMKKLGLL